MNQKIKVYDHLLNKRVLQEVNEHLNKANYQYGWGSNEKYPFRHWHVNIAGTGLESSVDVRDELPQAYKRLWAELNLTAFNDRAKLLTCYSNRHTYGIEGFMHKDSEDEKSVTIVVYMNKRWEPDWAGETVFFTYEGNDIVRSVMPIYGRYAIFPGNVPHAARAPSRVCPDVRTTLMFKAVIQDEKPFNEREYVSDFLSALGAHQKPHMNGSLKDHLMKTYDIIQESFPFFADVNLIAMVGGLHSIYGTNFYKNGCMELTDTFLPKKFGGEVDRLVRLFATINKPHVLTNPDGSLSTDDLRILRAVEVANLLEQNSLQQHPSLMMFLMTKGAI